MTSASRPDLGFNSVLPWDYLENTTSEAYKLSEKFQQCQALRNNKNDQIYDLDVSLKTYLQDCQGHPKISNGVRRQMQNLIYQHRNDEIEMTLKCNFRTVRVIGKIPTVSDVSAPETVQCSAMPKLHYLRYTDLIEYLHFNKRSLEYLLELNLESTAGNLSSPSHYSFVNLLLSFIDSSKFIISPTSFLTYSQDQDNLRLNLFRFDKSINSNNFLNFLIVYKMYEIFLQYILI